MRIHLDKNIFVDEKSQRTQWRKPALFKISSLNCDVLLKSIQVHNYSLVMGSLKNSPADDERD